MGSKLYLFLAAITLSNVGCIYWLQHLISLQKAGQPSTNMNALLRDFRLTWPIHDLPAVAMPIEDTLRYQFNSTDANSEWEALLPNDGMIYLGPERKPHTISMLHQLRCLDMLRRHIMHLDWPQRDNGLTPAPEDRRDLTQHCLLYLRQMAVCHADTGLESFAGPRASSQDSIARCKDWRVVYDALSPNSMGW